MWRIKRARNSKQIEFRKIEETGTGDIVPNAFKAHRDRVLAAEIAQRLG